jgi:flagellar basal-body rod protein FlgG
MFIASPDANILKNADATIVHQGSLEKSNVNVVTEMVNMIEINRIFQSYQKIITSIDETTDRLIEGVGPTA